MLDIELGKLKSEFDLKFTVFTRWFATTPLISSLGQH
jgi:hypothetical protein